MLAATRNLLWRIAAAIAVALAIIGIVVPVLPTVPFLIFAAFAGGKGWPQLERWLLNHPKHGPYIRAWREHGAVPRKAKILATVLMLASALSLAVVDVPRWLQWSITAFLACVAVWLWTRPEQER